MTKFLISLLMITSSYATTPLQEFDKNVGSIKEIRVKRPNYNNPLIFDGKLEKNHRLLTESISEKKYATDDERIQVLGGILQDRIVATRFKNLDFMPQINDNHKPHERNHLAALAWMIQGMDALIANPSLGMKRSYLIKNLLDKNPQDLHEDHKKYRNQEALKVLFPKKYFKSIATYAYGFQDFNVQYDLITALAFKSADISADNGFNVAQGTMLTFQNLGGQNQPMGKITLTGKNPDVSKEIIYRQKTDCPEDQQFQALFPYEKFGPYEIISSFKTPMKTYHHPEVLARLMTLPASDYGLNVAYYSDENGLSPVSLERPGFKVNEAVATPLKMLLKDLFNQVNVRDLLQAINQLPKNLQKTIQPKIKWLQAYQRLGINHITTENLSEQAVMRAAIAKQTGLSEFDISDGMLKHFSYDSDTDELGITDGAYKDLGDLGGNLIKQKERIRDESISVHFKNKIIGTQMPLPLFFEDKVEEFKNLLDIPLYRDNDFLIGICQALHDKDLDGDKILDDNQAAFVQELAKNGEDISKQLYHYFLTLGLLKNRSPGGAYDDLNSFWDDPRWINEKDDLLDVWREAMDGIDDFHDIPQEDRDARALELMGMHRFAPDQNSWVERCLQYIDHHSGTGTLMIFEEAYRDNGQYINEMRRNEFLADDMFPRILLNEKNDEYHKMGEQKTYDLVLNCGTTPQDMGIRMYVHENAHKGFWFLADNRNAFANLSPTQDDVIHAMDTMQDYGHLPIQIKSLLVKLLWQNLYG